MATVVERINVLEQRKYDLIIQQYDLERSPLWWNIERELETIEDELFELYQQAPVQSGTPVTMVLTVNDPDYWDEVPL